MYTTGTPALPKPYRMQACIQLARIGDYVLIALPVIGQVISVFSWQLTEELDSPEDITEMYRRC